MGWITDLITAVKLCALLILVLFRVLLKTLLQPFIYNPNKQTMISYDDATSFGPYNIFMFQIIGQGSLWSSPFPSVDSRQG
jgi:hypothetical protein